MARIWLLCLLLLFVSYPGAGCYPGQQDNAMQEAKEADPYTWNFGRVKKGAVLRHAFRLKNKSGKILNILDVSTSCGCTASLVQKKRLAPQESALIKVTFNTKGYSGPTQQYVYVHTDSLDNPIIRYIIKAEVVK